MTKAEFRKIIRGDVVHWTGPNPGKANMGLVRKVKPDRVYILWEDGLDAIYGDDDAKHLEHGA